MNLLGFISICLLFWCCNFVNGSAVLTTKVADLSFEEALPVGPAGTFKKDVRFFASQPQPPSIEGLELKSPAVPDEHAIRPPSPPDPHLLEIYEKDPDQFAAYFNKWKQENAQKNATKLTKRETNSPQLATYDQFRTAAVIVGLDFRLGPHTIFAPSDLYLKTVNLSLPLFSFTNMQCLRQLVRTHVIKGRYGPAQRADINVLSLEGFPVVFGAGQANGIPVLKIIETAGMMVYILDGIFTHSNMLSKCPELNYITRTQSDARIESMKHVINLRKVPTHVSFDEANEMFSNVKANDLNNIGEDILEAYSLDHDSSEYFTSPEANVPLELLDNINNFAHAMELAWQAEDNILAKLQSLGASTFVALLERSHLLDMLSSKGPWTVFAPDNDAWQDIPKQTLDYIMKDPVLLRQILSYHIVQTNASQEQFRNNLLLPSLDDSGPVYINFYSDGWASWYAASGSMIINLDEMASNGIVHVVRSVLFPPHGDLNATLQWTPALQIMASIFQKYIDITNLNDTVTAFLPVDSSLLTAKLSSLDPIAISDILARHLVRGTWFASGLIDGDYLYSISDDEIRVVQHEDCIGVNGACIVMRDITLTNGVLHVIDKLI